MSGLRQLGLFLVLLGIALTWTPAERAAAQAPSMRWDGFFELISGQYPYPPPWPGPPQPSTTPSRMTRHAITGDGRYVYFESDLHNYGMPGIYRRDRRTGQSELFFGNPIRNVSVSADGNHIAGEFADAWMRGDDQWITDVYAQSFQSWMWTLLSRAPDGTPGNDESSDAVLSSNGRFAVFLTKASNLSGGPLGVKQVMLRDRDADGNGILDEPGTDVLQTISVGGPGGTLPGNADSDSAEVSDDGRFVAFRSLASNLVPGDTNGTWDVFLHDRETGRNRRLNVGPEGQQSQFSIGLGQLSMSADGRYVAFASEDGQLAASSIDDTNGVLDVFVYDTESRWLTRIDIGGAPSDVHIPGNGPSGWPTLSADGRYLSLQSSATNTMVRPAEFGRTQVYVVDRADQRVTRISVKPDGQDLDEDSVLPSVSADGSVVLFWSKATNLYDIGVPSVEQLYAAVHLEIAPAEVVVPGGGGVGTFTVTAQQHTLWWAEWDWNQGWFGPWSRSPWAVGGGTVDFGTYEANPDPTPRSVSIRIGQSSATFTQDVGLSLTSVSPASGPMSGGTVVTLRGTGFVPGMDVYIGVMAQAEFVDSTTLTVVTPPYWQRGLVPVAIDTPDGRIAWLNDAFLYQDDTPPEVVGWTAGNEGQNGWYIGDVEVWWGWWDPESEVTSTTCTNLVVRTDTAGTTYTCSATSEGGTGYGSITVRRDATPPTITVDTPSPLQLIEFGSEALSAFTCGDNLSGVVNCNEGSPSGTPLDTSLPGWNYFVPGAMDAAGNWGSTIVEYAVSSGVCAYPLPELRGWWRFEGDTNNWMFSAPQTATRVGLTEDVYVDGVVGQAYQFAGTDGYLATNFSLTWGYEEKFAIAAWVKPSANTLGTILRRRQNYAVARLANGSLAWAFRSPDLSDLSYVDTGVKIPLDTWSHVVVDLDDTTVRTFLNGRLAHTATNIGYVYKSGNYGITIGGAEDRPDYFKGALDEVKVFDNGLDAGRIEQLYLAGAAGACVHERTRFEIAEPIPAYYGDATYTIAARLVDEHGMPAAGRSVTIDSQVSAWPHVTTTNTLVTDADGFVRWNAPLRGAVRGVYDKYLYVTFTGDTDYTRVLATPDVLVGKGNPLITWAAPGAMTYGTTLSETQLNATANVPGTFSYSPSWGTGLPAGTHTLTTTFTPQDASNYNIATAEVGLTVNKATPVVSVTGGTFMYDGTPHAVTGTVKTPSNVNLGTPTFTYNGSAEPPVDAGTYEVVASYAGNANYESASATTTLTIAKATPTVSVTGASFVYDGQPHAATGIVTGVGGASVGSLSFTYNGSSDVPVAAGSYEVVGTFAGNNNYSGASGTGTLTINKAIAALSWPTPAPIVYGMALNGLQLNATATVPGTFVYSPAAGTVLNAGTSQALTATFTPADQANYTVSTVSTSLDVNKFTPFIQVFTGARTYNGSPHGAGYLIHGIGEYLDASEVTYNGSSSASPINAGTYEVIVRYDGSANYNATSASALLVINKADPAIAWATPAGVTYGTALGAAQLNATSTVAGTFAYTPAAGSIPNAGSQTLSAVFTPADAGNYNNATASVTLAVGKAWPTVTVQFRTFTFDGQPHETTAFVTGVAGEPLGAPTVTYNGSSEVPVNAGSYRVFATYPGDANYEMISAEGVLLINKATPTITVTGGTFTYDGQPHASTGTATGVAGAQLGPLTFSYNGSASEPVSAGSYTVIGSFAGDSNYQAASAAATLVINKATPALSWSAPAAIGYGTTLSGAQLNASANVPGVFSYSPVAGIVLDAGSHTLTATFTPADSVNYEAGTVTTTLTVQKAAPVVTVTGGTFTYDGQPHGATASATGVDGVPLGPLTWTYNGSPDLPVNAGSYEVVVTFGGDNNTEAASATGTLTITRATPVLSWNAPGAIVYGTSLGTGQLNATSNVAGSFSYAPAAGTVLKAGPGQGLTATFAPADTVNYNGGTVAVTLSVTPAPLIVRATDAVKRFGEPLPPFTATFAGLTDGDSPASLAGVLALATTATQTSPVGAYPIVPGGVSSPNYTITFVNGTLSVVKGGVSMSVSAAPEPSGFEMPMTFTAIIAAAAPAAGSPGGTVRFFDGATLLGTAAISGGSATLKTAGLDPGVRTLEARYDGDSSFETGTASASHVVNAAASTPVVSIASSRNPSSTGQTVTFTANITMSAGPVSGTVDFFDGATLIGSSAIVSGRASLSTAELPAGSHAITARFSGNAPASVSPVFVQAVGATGWKNRATTTTVATLTNPSALGDTVMLTATVTGSSSSAPGGHVLFMIDGEVLGDRAGVAVAFVSGSTVRATLSVSGLAHGRHKVTATYLGDPIYKGSSGALTQTVN